MAVFWKFILAPAVATLGGRALLAILQVLGFDAVAWVEWFIPALARDRDSVVWILSFLIGAIIWGIGYYLIFYRSRKNPPPASAFHFPNPNKRYLTEDEKASLADAIRQVGLDRETLAVNHFRSSEECADFANDISSAIERAGYKVAFSHNIFSIDDPNERGIKINHGSSGKVVELANAVHGFFAAREFASERIPTNTEDTFNIYVARATGEPNE